MKSAEINRQNEGKRERLTINQLIDPLANMKIIQPKNNTGSEYGPSIR
ncbi:MAG TPA: hypothetical protein PLT92_13315 [Ignavibacteriaceae bacterium]|nr:hypothetical protein [Ignavibacteriaceae bacterium]